VPIGLHVLKQVDVVSRQGAKTSTVPVELLLGLIHRELQFPGTHGRPTARSHNGCLVDHVVQGGSQVVSPLADQNRHLWRGRLLLLHPHRVGAATDVHEARRERVAIDERVPDPGRLSTVLGGPVDAPPARLKALHA